MARNKKRQPEKLDKESTGYMDNSFQKIDQQMQKYPTLVYDGPFDHMELWNPKDLSGKAITEEDAKELPRIC